MKWRSICLAALLVRSADATIGSLPSFKTAYDTAVTSKTDWEVNQINQRVEGTAEPSDSGESALWNWYRMTSGTAKADAKTYMDAAFTARGGSSDLLSDFKTRVAVLYAANTPFADKFSNVYTHLSATTEPGTLTGLWKQYHGLTGAARTEADKAVVDPMETAFAGEWDLTAFVTQWDGTTYEKATKAAAGYLNYAAANYGACGADDVIIADDDNSGKKVFTAYKAISGDASLRNKLADFVALKVAGKL